MAAVLTEEPVEIRLDKDKSGDGRRRNAPTPVVRMDEIAGELGIWLSGIESFLAAGHHSFADSREARALPDSSKEFQLVHSTLQRCALLNARLLSGGNEAVTALGIEIGELKNLSSVLRDAMLLSGGLIHSNSLGSGEWKAWCSLLIHRFRGVPAFSKLIRFAEVEGEKYLPSPLRELAMSDDVLSAEHAEIALILPRFGKILKWLNVVGKMLEADEPLKTALLIFSRVNEQIFELTSCINNRLERFPDEEAELFESLDAAAYTASIELKKVYSQELAGLARVRPTPSIYERMATAHSLLNESFQQILAGFARMIDPTADIYELFPNFQTKFDQSLALRNELPELVKAVRAAEKNPAKRQIQTLQKLLREFMKGTVRFLFYKDGETVERFVEEILVTKENKDLVPILHRFGAYLETLFGQINLRTVLDKDRF